jgi:hypothetical protein
MIFGGDVAGEGAAGSPGSGGASPYSAAASRALTFPISKLAFMGYNGVQNRRLFFSRPQAVVFAPAVWPSTAIPLRDLCAMLIPVRLLLARRPRCPP